MSSKKLTFADFAYKMPINERTKKFTEDINTNPVIEKESSVNQYQDLTENIEQEQPTESTDYININYINVNLIS